MIFNPGNSVMWMLWPSFSRRNKRANNLMPQLIDGKFIVDVWLSHFSIPAVSIIPISSGHFDFLQSKAFLLLFVQDEFPETHFDYSVMTPYWFSTWHIFTVPRIMLPTIRICVPSGYYYSICTRILVCVVLFWYKVAVLMVWWCAELHLVCWVISLIWLWCLWRLSTHQFMQFWFLTHKTGADGPGTQ